MEVSLQLSLELGRDPMPCAEDVDGVDASLLSVVVGTKLWVVDTTVVKDEADVSLQLSVGLRRVAMPCAEDVEEVEASVLSVVV